MSTLYLLVLIVSGLWILSEVSLALLRRSSTTNRVTQQKEGSFWWLWLTIIPCTMVGGFWSVQPLGFIKFARQSIMCLGLMSIVIGLAIRWIAIYTLRKYFTVDVAIFKDHKIIKSGLYKSIRHPAYAGSLISFFGLGWALGNWMSFIIIFFPILFAFLRRMNIEEKALVWSVGEEYEEYMRKTKRLIPKVY
jgi:protein-S-isoprenylcysteine O-methyltransferase Ste14